MKCVDGAKERGIVSLPGLANVYHVDAVHASFPEVGFHVNLEVFGTDVALSCEEHLNVLRGGIEDWGEI